MSCFYNLTRFPLLIRQSVANIHDCLTLSGLPSYPQVTLRATSPVMIRSDLDLHTLVMGNDSTAISIPGSISLTVLLSLLLLL